MGGDFRAILCAFKVAHFGHDLVDGTVDALGLRVERVDETSQQAIAFVGVHILATLKREHMIREGRAEGIDSQVRTDRDAQERIQGEAAE